MAYSAWASESHAFAPSFIMMCHSFQAPCGYWYEIRPIITKALFRYTPSAFIWRGELSGGMSATCPTFRRSKSVRTRMLLQYSQTVWTLLDHRKITFAPQFGHDETTCVIKARRPLTQVVDLSQSLAAWRKGCSYIRAICRTAT